jgi:hypothetical protein
MTGLQKKNEKKKKARPLIENRNVCPKDITWGQL